MFFFKDLCMDFFCNSNFGWNQYFLYRTRISNLAGRKRTLWYGRSINRCFRKRSVGICWRGLIISLSQRWVWSLFLWAMITNDHFAKSWATIMYNLAEDLDIHPEILFSSAWSFFALLKGRANKDQNFLFVFHCSHSA